MVMFYGPVPFGAAIPFVEDDAFDERDPWPIFNALRKDPSVNAMDLYPAHLMPRLSAFDSNAQDDREDYLRQKFWYHHIVQKYQWWYYKKYVVNSSGPPMMYGNAFPADQPMLPYRANNCECSECVAQIVPRKYSSEDKVTKLLQEVAEKLRALELVEEEEEEEDFEEDAFDERDPWPIFHALRKDPEINVQDLYPKYLMSGFCSFDSNALDSREIYLREQFKDHKIVRKYEKWVKVKFPPRNQSFISNDDTSTEGEYY